VTASARLRIQFGVYELDLQAGHLYKGRTRVRVQDQPLRVLIALLNRPGEVVTREELKQDLWPSDTFVDFEHGLSAAVNKLRQALNDDPEKPRYVETLPRRGYRFIFPVAAVQSPTVLENGHANNTKPANRARPFWWRAASGFALAGLTMAGSVVWLLSRKSHPLTDRDTVVLADFANDTGDSVFDGTLRQGLSVELAQSPFLSVVSDKQVRQTLLMMKQPEDAKLTPGLAEEVCRRNGSTAILSGSIAQIGTQYALVLKAEDCSDGKLIVSAEARASDKSRVLDALGKASASLRKQLGESLGTVEKFDTPLEQATTPSLEALQAYDAGYKLADKGDYDAALPFFQRARSIDPNFAMASLFIGMMQGNLGHAKDMAPNLQRAFDQRRGVSERERLFIEVEYSESKQGQGAQDAWRTSATLWARTYPRDCVGHGELAFFYFVREEFDKALPEEQEAHRLCPGDGLSSAGLISLYRALNRLPEARAVSEEPRVKDVDSFEVHKALYFVAFLQNDVVTMDREVAFAAGKPGLEDQMWFAQAQTAAYYGRMKDSREFSRKAVASALEAHENERAVSYVEAQGLFEAYVGNMAEARRQLSSALRLPGAANDGYLVLELLARFGDEGHFRPLAEKYGKENVNDPYTQEIQLPEWNALLALARHKAPAAVEILRSIPDESSSRCPDDTYLRGLAFLANGQGKEAGPEFQKMIACGNLLTNDPQRSLSHLQLARALVLQGDTARARAAYQDFLNLWKNADLDVPVLRQAKAEMRELALTADN
jgi:eukaryotic-like serine/threonine-protein kinase